MPPGLESGSYRFSRMECKRYMPSLLRIFFSERVEMSLQYLLASSESGMFLCVFVVDRMREQMKSGGGARGR